MDEDLEQPGLERGATLKALEPANHSHPGVLNGLLSHGLARNERASEAQHRLLVTTDQHHEGLLVALAQSSEQLDVHLHIPDRMALRGGLRRRLVAVT